MSARVLGLALVLLSACGPAWAQAFTFESDQPIEITADSLEVVQADRIATFSGNVDAVQGDLVLSADELLVHYRGSGEPAAPGSSGAIRRIEARGNVVVTSPRETAEGEVGVYDVAGALVTLEGSVVLTRDDNVVRGDRLELDLASGVSRVVATTTAAEGTAPERRVRAVFVPSEQDAEGEAAGSQRDRATQDAGAAPEKNPAPSSAGPPPVPRSKPGESVEDGG